MDEGMESFQHHSTITNTYSPLFACPTSAASTAAATGATTTRCSPSPLRLQRCFLRNEGVADLTAKGETQQFLRALGRVSPWCMKECGYHSYSARTERIANRLIRVKSSPPSEYLVTGHWLGIFVPFGMMRFPGTGTSDEKGRQ
ncbi:hypothetical protein Q8A73_005191 [Channa argus]|nr:hypothetical protein Q8A73_005191 [Channa argus]